MFGVYYTIKTQNLQIKKVRLNFSDPSAIFSFYPKSNFGETLFDAKSTKIGYPLAFWLYKPQHLPVLTSHVSIKLPKNLLNPLDAVFIAILFSEFQYNLEFFLRLLSAP